MPKQGQTSSPAARSRTRPAPSTSTFDCSSNNMPIELDTIRRLLPGRRIDWHASIASTMIEASRLSAAGCAHGTVAGADEQTAGMGRYGRHWHSEPDAGIYMSVVLRLPFSTETLPLVTLALELAVAESIQNATGVACDLRWPN